MSLRQTESVRAYKALSDALTDIRDIMTDEEWEKLSL